MSANCQQAAQELGNGVAAALRRVDCVAGETSAAAFGRLFASGGQTQGHEVDMVAEHGGDARAVATEGHGAHIQLIHRIDHGVDRAGQAAGTGTAHA